MAQYDGTQDPDDILGGGGNDVIIGYSGDDSLRGGGGHDTIDGGADEDNLFGDAGNDSLRGDSQDDFLSGGTGNDYLDGGYGADVIWGGDGDDFIEGRNGGDDDRDLLHGDAGNDRFQGFFEDDEIYGGSGNDSFGYWNENNGWDFFINGGEGGDVIFVSMRPDDLQYEINLGDTWETTNVSLIFKPSNTVYSAGLNSVEKILFSDTFSVSSKYYTVTEIQTLDRSSEVRNSSGIVAEMSLLATNAYSGNITGQWRPLSAIELGILPSNFGEGDIDYTFLNGVYSVETLGPLAHGEVMALCGVLNGVRSITLAFRGTDEHPTDELTYDFFKNYSKFIPFVDAIKAYARGNGISQILLTGHSMGAALVQESLGRSFSDWANVKAFAFASPGTSRDAALSADPTKIVTFNQQYDFINLASDSGINALAGVKIELNAPILDLIIETTKNVAIVKFLELIAKTPTIFGVGMMLRDALVFAVGVHDPHRYLKTLTHLSQMSADASNEGFYNSQFAQSLRLGKVWNEKSLKVAVGTEGAETLIVGKDDYVIGGGSNDVIRIWDVMANPQRVVDGGRGRDTAVLLARGTYTMVGTEEKFKLYLSDQLIGNFYGVELLYTPFGPQHTSGRTASIQTPSAAGTFVLRTGYDAADSGSGARTVVGTSSSDVIYAGTGNQTINGNAGDDVLIVRGNGSESSSDIVVLDGGTGGDIMMGGGGSEQFHVDSLLDIVIGGEGIDNVYSRVDFALPDDVENLFLSSLASLGLGNQKSNSIVAGSTAAILYGFDGDDTLVGGLGADTINGGAGSDRLDGNGGTDILTGGPGNDTYFVQDTGDKVVELTGEGADDHILSSVSYNLSGRYVETLTLTGNGHINATGNSLANALNGNAGNNVLDGGAGNDTMAGGLGNDTYYVQAAGDKVVENGGEGTDTIFSTISYSLNARYAEVLTLTGLANVSATGNSLANTLNGNAGNNTINGKGGKDSLSGGLGSDIFLFEAASGKDTITDFSGSQNDSINVNAYTAGTANAAMVTQAGANVLINLGGGNTVTVLNATQADVLSHMVW